MTQTEAEVVDFGSGPIELDLDDGTPVDPELEARLLEKPWLIPFYICDGWLEITPEVSDFLAAEAEKAGKMLEEYETYALVKDHPLFTALVRRPPENLAVA